MATNRAYYCNSIIEFVQSPTELILGELTNRSEFDVVQLQRDAWREQIEILRQTLTHRNGEVYLEFSIPRMGRRIDAVLLIGPIVFVVEFKIGEIESRSAARDQVWDYGLDLKNFHETSCNHPVVPVLVVSRADLNTPQSDSARGDDGLLAPITCNAQSFGFVLDSVLSSVAGNTIDSVTWESGRYCPTPTIIEAAMALYRDHTVSEISSNEAKAINLNVTSESISRIIQDAKDHSQKSICFVTGVPGAGKTLVGLKIATTHIKKSDDLHSVFLSGNGPLVDILREALVRDRVRRESERGRKVKKGSIRSEVKMFIQNVHHFRDDCLVDPVKPPIEHVAIFDEAQRAWTLQKTSNFMSRKKNTPNFAQSEPEFLISCMDRHRDWAVIVCLVGGGQEINTGEAGIREWIESLNRSFPDWHVYVSSQITDSEYMGGGALHAIESRQHVIHQDDLHLAVSMRSFRAEHVSQFVKQLLDIDVEKARMTLDQFKSKYPIVLSRNLKKAKQWLKDRARGTERYGIVVSSQAERLRPLAINVKSPMKPIHWFLDPKEDVRSSFYLEDVATEFAVQGLELDWTCVTWDADFRRAKNGWNHWSFRGNRWQRIKNEANQSYQKNAYRVLLTRARQGMVIVVPQGNESDPTRLPEYYDPTFDYLKRLGLEVI